MNVIARIRNQELPGETANGYATVVRAHAYASSPPAAINRTRSTRISVTFSSASSRDRIASAASSACLLRSMFRELEIGSLLLCQNGMRGGLRILASRFVRMLLLAIVEITIDVRNR
jgi:hypothetical protein